MQRIAEGTAARAGRRETTPLAGAVFWTLAGTVALAPLPLASYRIWSWSLLGIVVGLLLVAWSAGAVLNRRLITVSWRRYRVPLLLFAAVAAWAGFQISGMGPASLHHPIWAEAGAALGETLPGAIAVNPPGGLYDLMHMVTYAAVFFLAMQLGTSSARARGALWILAVAGLLYALYGLAQVLAGYERVLWYPKMSLRGIVTSTLLGKNIYAAFAGLGLLVTLALFRREVTRAIAYRLWSRAGVLHFLENVRPAFFFLLASGMVIATALLLAQSRGGVISTGLGIVVLLAALSAGGRRRGFGETALVLVVLAVGGALLVSVSGGPVAERFADIVAASGGRQALHDTTIRAIADRPWLGTGLGSFAGVFSAYRNETLAAVDAAFLRAHSTYLELALELGLPAFGALMLALALVVYRCFRGVLDRRRERIFPALGLAASALVGSHSLFDFSMQVPGVAATYFFVLGIAYAQSWPRRNNRRRVDEGAAAGAGGRVIREGSARRRRNGEARPERA